MKTRIIDLFNKVANEEEVPRLIKHDGIVWEFDDKYNDYRNEGKWLFISCLDSYKNTKDCLNAEVKIMGEDKEMEKGIKPFEEYWEEVEVVGCDKDEAKKVYLDRLSKIVIELTEELNELKKGK